MGYSDSSSPFPLPETLWAVSTPPGAQEAVLGGRETFCGLAAHTDTRKVARALVEHLNDAVCCTANRLKSSVEKLYEKPWSSLQCSPEGRNREAFRSISPFICQPNPRSECCSSSFSDSFGRCFLGSSLRGFEDYPFG
jgi:hypothetical protein